MSAVIEARGLSKVFQTTVRRPGFAGALRSLVSPQRVAKAAVQDVEFSVGKGELLALLGPNGAGKSTTIKMLTGILTPTSGEALVAGVVPHRDRERNAHNIGAVFGQRTQLWWDLPARESFEILRDIYGVPEAQFRARIEEFDGLLELSEFWDTRVRHLSLGQRVRCDLAASLLHDPPVVFLDEPTIGMDVVVKEQVRRFLRHQVEERDRTVLLTTHDMTEVERLAERVVLINHGRIVLDGPLQEIRRRFGGTWQVRATLADPADVEEIERGEGTSGPASPDGTAALPGPVPLPGFAGIGVLRREGPRVVFGPVGEDAPTVHEALKVIIGRFRVADLALEENDLEDVMRAAYLSDVPAQEPATVTPAAAQGG
ncbi:ABC transporter ATP-binding protein [Streptomyces sp. CA-210063]|uniref:ABC transporter ATP-binding protein n=1 Tax=Streptomyces sp. CA-210063 TaxID=2801029 RepID=UPI003FA70BF9